VSRILFGRCKVDYKLKAGTLRLSYEIVLSSTSVEVQDSKFPADVCFVYTKAPATATMVREKD
jgi:hypothetical protein